MIRPGNAMIFAIGESGPGGVGRLGVVLLTVVAVVWTAISGDGRSAGRPLVTASGGDADRIESAVSGWDLMAGLKAPVGRDVAVGALLAGDIPFDSETVEAAELVEEVVAEEVPVGGSLSDDRVLSPVVSEVSAAGAVESCCDSNVPEGRNGVDGLRCLGHGGVLDVVVVFDSVVEGGTAVAVDDAS